MILGKHANERQICLALRFAYCHRFRVNTFKWQATGINYLAGTLAFFPFGLVLWLGTIPIIRRKFFKVRTEGYDNLIQTLSLIAIVLEETILNG